jgi:hypothetical protein
VAFGPFYVGDIPATVLAITVSRDGATLDLAPYNAATVLVENPAGASITWVGTVTIDPAADVVNVAFGATSNFATAGIYTMRVRLTTAGGAIETSQPVQILVYPAPAALPALAEVKAYLGANSATDEQIQDALDTELQAQRDICAVPAVYPASLRQAVKRRVARNLSMQRIPLAVLQGDTEAGTAAALPPGSDPEVRRLEKPYLRLLVA